MDVSAAIKFRRSSPHDPGSWKQLMVYLCFFWNGLAIVTWMMLLFAPLWHIKLSLFYELRISLWTVELRKGVASAVLKGTVNAVSPEVGKKLEQIGTWPYRKYPLQEFRERMCALRIPTYDICSVWIQVWAGSLLQVSLGLVGVVCLAIGGLFLGAYTFGTPDPRHRKRAGVFLALGPVVGWISIASYALLTVDLKDLAPRGPLTYGPCTAAALLHVAFAAVPALIAVSCLGEQTPEEVAHLGQRAARDEARELQLAELQARALGLGPFQGQPAAWPPQAAGGAIAAAPPPAAPAVACPQYSPEGYGGGHGDLRLQGWETGARWAVGANPSGPVLGAGVGGF